MAFQHISKEDFHMSSEPYLQIEERMYTETFMLPNIANPLCKEQIQKRITTQERHISKLQRFTEGCVHSH